MISRYRTCGNTKTFHSGGRSRLTSNPDDKAIIRLIEKDPFISAKNIKSQIDLNIAVRIIYGQLTVFSGQSYNSLKNRKASLEF